MKVFNIICGNDTHIIAAKSQELAIEYLNEHITGNYDKIEEVPESKWDEKTINIWEDNDFEKEPFKISIREEMIGEEPQLLCSTDLDLIN